MNLKYLTVVCLPSNNVLDTWGTWGTASSSLGSASVKTHRFPDSLGKEQQPQSHLPGQVFIFFEQSGRLVTGRWRGGAASSHTQPMTETQP